MKNPVFTGAGVAIITPMYPDGSINYEKFAELIEYQIAHQTDAIVVCGTTGESAAMSEKEHMECVEFAVRQTAGRIPVIAGAGSNDTAVACELSKASKAAGADALLHVTPYYNKTSQRGLVAHFTAVADATDLPVILYNVPGRTGVNISVDTYAELSRHPHIAATKEASGSVAHVAAIRARCGEDLVVYSGEDGLITPILSLGGAGVISVLSNVIPEETHAICQRFFDGDVQGSAELQLKYLDLVNALFMDVNPIPVKDAMNLMGWDVGECRLPLVGMTEVQKAKLADVMRSAGVLK